MAYVLPSDTIMKKRKLLVVALLVSPAVLAMSHAAVYTLSTGTFSTGSTQGWSGVGSTTLTSNTADTTNFPNSPVLNASSPGSGSITRASLSFASTTLISTGDYLTISYRVKGTGLSNANRRYQTAFWNSSAADGYLLQQRAGDNTYAANTFAETASLPTTGTMDGGRTDLTTSGGTTISFGNSNTAVHLIEFTITKSATGVNLSYKMDNGTAITASDTSSAYLTFDRFDTNFWGNTVNFRLDDVSVTTSVPESSAAMLGGLSMLVLFRRRR